MRSKLNHNQFVSIEFHSENRSRINSSLKCQHFQFGSVPCKNVRIDKREFKFDLSSAKQPYMNSKLRPDAPVYLPPSRDSTILRRSFESSPILFKPDEPQCSRYSRRSVRYIQSISNSPRPILGTKMSHLRAILGRREENSNSTEDEHEKTQTDTIEKEDVEDKENNSSEITG
ncbi:hypothetical protein WA026_009411 [Henosepilachna vigintioctopunctata]|uniref:Uncharacterized protein n=1 Tax=Henosepilachna vigintioctopunctata TaxID=420089 RepID=A0AAW1U4M4_9CUCU